MCFRNESFFSSGLVLFHMEVVERKERAPCPPVDLQNTWSGHLANGEGRCSDLQEAAQEKCFFRGSGYFVIQDVLPLAPILTGWLWQECSAKNHCIAPSLWQRSKAKQDWRCGGRHS